MIPIAAAGGGVLERIAISSGWEAAASHDALDPDRLRGLRFNPILVPGRIPDASDSCEYWFRCQFEAGPAEAGEEVLLRIGGIATLSEAWLNGHPIFTSSSMFSSHSVDISGVLRGSDNQLLIVCRSLTAALRRMRGKPPLPRWRTRVVAEQQLRWFRTGILGRAPGFAPGPPLVGIWRPIELERRRRLAIDRWSSLAELDDATGVIRVELQMRPLSPEAKPVSARMISEQHSAPMECEGSLASGVLRIPNARRWWPHTHGEPSMYPLRIEIQLEDGSEALLEGRPLGFRSIQPREGFGLSLNRAPIFCRGVVWTPAESEAVRDRLLLFRDAGFNLIRVPGTGAYESDLFHSLCDELGLLVWQDMMFANMDYPLTDHVFLGTVRREAEQELERIGRHPSTAVICGNSEIEQQVGMLGLEPSLARDAFFAQDLPTISARLCPGVPYVPSAPCGGDQAFRTHKGVANYFGVGAYRRPIEDVRRSAVRFASECLAFANMPEPEMVDRMARSTPGGISPTHPAWKQAVPRDAGAGWDFEDVRDHYLNLLYGVDPSALRSHDPERYRELSRLVSGEVMSEVFGEWRRPDSNCNGGIILWGADLMPGAGWGILDSAGVPKAAYWFLKRILAPRSIWTTDEGLNGVDVHIANDRPAPLDSWVRVALYADGERKVAEAGRRIEIRGRGRETFGLEEILGRFVDASYAYKFGPPGHDVIAVSLHQDPDGPPIAQSFRFRAAGLSDRRDLRIEARARALAGGRVEVAITAQRFAWGVRVSAPGAMPDDCYFAIEPGGSARTIVLSPVPGFEGPIQRVAVSAFNAGSVPVALEMAA